MWTALKLFFSTNVVRVVEWLAIIGGALLTVLTIFNAGKKSEQVDELKAVLRDTGKSHEIENKNSALSDADVDSELRSKWGK